MGTLGSKDGEARCAYAVTLRPAGHADSPFLSALRRDPDCAAASFAPPPQDWAAYERWLSEHISTIQIIEYDAVPLGMMRLDGDEVHSALVPEARGWGIGTDVLRFVCAGRPKLMARVKAWNTPNLRAFMKAGFTPTVIELEWQA